MWAPQNLEPESNPPTNREHRAIRRQQQVDSWFVFFSLVVFPLMQGRGELWYAGGWTGFPGPESAAEQGVRAACAAARLGSMVTLPTQAKQIFAGGCISVPLYVGGGGTPELRQFCDDDAIFKYLVANYCAPQSGLVRTNLRGRSVLVRVTHSVAPAVHRRPHAACCDGWYEGLSTDMVAPNRNCAVLYW